MFEGFRQSLNDLMDRATSPEDRRAGLAQMKQTLVQAKMGLDDLRGGVTQTQQRLQAEQRELETMRRRKAAAEAINDAETVVLAEKHETLHAGRADVLTRKLAAQEEELAMVDAEVMQMTQDLKKAVTSGAAPGPSQQSFADQGRAEADAVLDEHANVSDEIDALRRSSARSTREAEADRQLAELKRRMGK